MADESHLSVLKQGVEAWNQWRRERQRGFPDLSGADLRRANLGGVVLNWVNLREADLSGAKLSEANLGGATLWRTLLDGTNFERATVGRTVFADIDFSPSRRLESVRHRAPSILGVDSIIRSKGRIPEIFLREVGLPDEWIERIPSLTGASNQFFSCFISYSSLDKLFADRLL